MGLMGFGGDGCGGKIWWGGGGDCGSWFAIWGWVRVRVGLGSRFGAG